MRHRTASMSNSLNRFCPIMSKENDFARANIVGGTLAGRGLDLSSI